MKTEIVFFRFTAFVLLVAFFFTSCISTPPQQGMNPIPAQKIQHQTAQKWTGDGGRGRSITILPPRAIGLSEDQAYLPDYVANELLSNFRSFSAMTLFDRVNNQRQYEELLSGYYADDDEAGMDLGNLASTDYMLLGDIIRTSTGYALQLTINRNKDKTTEASYSGTVSIAELDNLVGVRKASLDLLPKMGVQLTAEARTELTIAATANHVTAQTALAQGITAQRQGTEVVALNYFSVAAAFDPSLLEAVTRSSILTANISSGNIGDDARNDIAWRRDWIARLTETEQLFNNYFNDFLKTIPPMSFSLYYTGNIRQIGEINYRNETVTLSGISAKLIPSRNWVQSIEPVFQPMQASLQTVLDGLNATRRKTVWGLGNWPEQGSFNLQPFGRRQTQNFSIAVELLNNHNQVIGKQTFQTSCSYILPVPLPGRGAQKIQVIMDDINTVNFPNVNANYITENMTIRIAAVNGTDAETAARNGVMQIMAIPKNEFDSYSRFKYNLGEIQGFANKETGVTNLVIPFTIWGEPVTSIAAHAFENNQFTSVTLPNSVTFIGERAFFCKSQSNDNKITSITIGTNVSMAEEAFGYANYYVDNDFQIFYNQNGKRAGVYTYVYSSLQSSGKWVYDIQGDNTSVIKANRENTVSIVLVVVLGIATVIYGLLNSDKNQQMRL